jgi:hypothetical protein
MKDRHPVCIWIMDSCNDHCLYITIARLFPSAIIAPELLDGDTRHLEYRRNYIASSTKNKVDWKHFLETEAPSSTYCLVAVIGGLQGSYPTFIQMEIYYLNQPFTEAEVNRAPEIVEFWNDFVCKHGLSLPRTYVSECWQGRVI